MPGRSSNGRSRQETTPTIRSPCTTGMWRKLHSSMRRIASTTGAEPSIVSGSAVITSPTGVVAGSRPAATTRTSRSRSVKMPRSRPPSQSRMLLQQASAIRIATA